VYCWGRSPVDGTPSTTPRLVSGAMVFDSLTVGGHLCGLTGSGSAYCWGTTGWGSPGWGNNDWGQLGDGTFASRTTPTAVAGGLTFQSLSAGTEYTCGVTTAGAAYCWGYNGSGELGDGTVQERPVPTAVIGGLTFRFVRSATSHACGITTDGSAYCWYGSGGAHLGGSILSSSPPVPVSGGLTFTDIDVSTTHSSHERHSCAIAGGSAYCWGQSGDGNLGDGSTRPFERVAPGLVSGPHVYAAITTGTNSAGDFRPRHTCALTTLGAVLCWGSNESGQVGDGSFSPRTTPTAVVGSVP
jgi:alpha-tubulin suppressor-like RCC1 family protein